MGKEHRGRKRTWSVGGGDAGEEGRRRFSAVRVNGESTTWIVRELLAASRYKGRRDARVRRVCAVTTNVPFVPTNLSPSSSLSPSLPPLCRTLALFLASRRRVRRSLTWEKELRVPPSRPSACERSRWKTGASPLRVSSPEKFSSALIAD